MQWTSSFDNNRENREVKTHKSTSPWLPAYPTMPTVLNKYYLFQVVRKLASQGRVRLRNTSEVSSLGQY